MFEKLLTISALSFGLVLLRDKPYIESMGWEKYKEHILEEIAIFDQEQEEKDVFLIHLEEAYKRITLTTQEYNLLNEANDILNKF